MKDLDGRGIPGAMIATTEFEDAAKSQAKTIAPAPSRADHTRTDWICATVSSTATR
jgi:hypothetical protein